MFPTIAGRSGRARRRSRQWHAVPGFADIFAFRAAFPMNAGRCSVWSLTRPCVQRHGMVQTVHFWTRSLSCLLFFMAGAVLGKVVDTSVVYNDRGHGPDSAVPGQGYSARSLTRPLCTTTGVMVHTVQFLDKGYSARSLTRPMCTTTGVMVQTVQFLDKVT